MSLIKDTWRQLVRRRLWPVAVLLLAALVAVPVLLAKSPATPPPAAAPAPSADESKAPAGGGLTTQPVVAMADEAARGPRHVLGARKDPFAPAPQPKPKKTSSPVPSVTTPSPTGGTQPTSPTGGTTPVTVGPTTPVGGFTPPAGGTVPPTTAPPAPHVKPPAPGTLSVRFGDATTDPLPSMKVHKLDALPDSDQPVAIYVGTTHGGRVAKFLVDSSVTPEGDGRCLPSPADCQTVELRAGETEFFTVADDTSSSSSSSSTSGSSDSSVAASGQYELDLVHIVKPKAKKRAKATRATRARTAHAGGVIARVVRLLKP